MKPFEKLFDKYYRIVFFDTETTGYDPEKDQVIELAMLAVEQDEETGEPKIVKAMDNFVQLEHVPELPQKIRDLTGIMELQLQTEGISEMEMLQKFSDMIFPCYERSISSDMFFRRLTQRVLLVAHNAQFDLSFIAHGMMRYSERAKESYRISRWFDAWKWADFLDTLTVYKDRRPYPNRLESAITAYGLDGKVKNSHRAIDDVEALYEVCRAMDAERPDLDEYVNLFGFNPKYGVEGKKIKRVSYHAQRGADIAITSEGRRLPDIVKREAGVKEGDGD